MQLKNKLSSMLRFELLFCLFLICLLIVFYIVSLEYSAIARRSPYYVMVPLSIFLLTKKSFLDINQRHNDCKIFRNYP